MEPGNRIHFDRGIALFSLRRWPESIRAFRQHLAEQPEDASALANCAAAYLNCSPPKSHRARATCDESLRIAPEFPYALYIRAICAQHVFTHRADSKYTADEMQEESRRLLLDALRHDPHFVDAWVLLAQVERNLKHRQASGEAIAQALKIDSHNVAALILRAEHEQASGRKSEAMQTSIRALAAGPEDPRAHLLHGQQLLNTRDRRRAQQHFREALRIDPMSDSARRAFFSVMPTPAMDEYSLSAWARWLWQKLVPRTAKSELSRRKGLILFVSFVITFSVLQPQLEKLPDRPRQLVLSSMLVILVVLLLRSGWHRVKVAWKQRERRPRRRRPD